MKKSPEPIILAIALGLLALGAAGLAYVFPTVQDITGIPSLQPKGKPAAKLKAEQIQASLADWTAPALWNAPANGHPLFDSAKFLFYPSAYPSGDYLKKMIPGIRSPSGVLLDWYQKYGLDFADGSVDREDPDGDGFSNITEFKNEQIGQKVKAADCDGTQSTNPLDAKSHPDYLARLRLQKYEKRSFHIKFNGYQQLNGEYVFQIHLDEVPSDRQPGFLHKGDKLGFENYVIGDFHLNIVSEKDPHTGAVEQKDRSTLDLIKPDIGFKITLPFQQNIDSPESTADFVMLMPSEVDNVFKVARGKILTVPYLTDTPFLVIEVKDDGATIRDTKSKKEYTIPKLDQDEWNEVPVAAQPTKTP